MTLSSGDLTTIVAALQNSDWDAAEVVIGDVKIAVARNGHHWMTSPTEPSPQPQQVSTAPPTVELPTPAAVAKDAPQPNQSISSPETSPADSSDIVITAPSVGIFWRAPEPGAAPFVEIGGTVQPDQTVCIIEIMKLMSNVSAHTAGTVTAIHVENGQAVEFGTPLMSIRPESV